MVRDMNGILGSDDVVAGQWIENDKTVGANKRRYQLRFAVDLGHFFKT